MAIHNESRDSLRNQLDDAKEKQLLYKHRVTRLENRSQYLACGNYKKRTHHLYAITADGQGIASRTLRMAKQQPAGRLKMYREGTQWMVRLKE